MEGILTQEDLVEALLGMEIIDESDTNPDMQALAKTLWLNRAKKMGLKHQPEEVKKK